MHEHIAVKTIFALWSPHYLTIARVDCSIEMLENYDGNASKDIYKIVTGEKSARNKATVHRVGP